MVSGALPLKRSWSSSSSVVVPPPSERGYSEHTPLPDSRGNPPPLSSEVVRGLLDRLELRSSGRAPHPGSLRAGVCASTLEYHHHAGAESSYLEPVLELGSYPLELGV